MPIKNPKKKKRRVKAKSKKTNLKMLAACPIKNLPRSRKAKNLKKNRKIN